MDQTQCFAVQSFFTYEILSIINVMKNSTLVILRKQIWYLLMNQNY